MGVDPAARRSIHSRWFCWSKSRFFHPIRLKLGFNKRQPPLILLAFSLCSRFLGGTFRQHGRAAMYHLECLSLQFDIYDDSAERALPDSGREGKPKFVDLLAAALLDMPGLRRLSLSGTEVHDGELLLSTRELFQAARLPALEDLSLRVISGSAAGILAFLRAQPRLRKLRLRAIELSEGTWPKIVDDMRRWLHLESLSF